MITKSSYPIVEEFDQSSFQIDQKSNGLAAAINDELLNTFIREQRLEKERMLHEQNSKYPDHNNNGATPSSA